MKFGLIRYDHLPKWHTPRKSVARWEKVSCFAMTESRLNKIVSLSFNVTVGVLEKFSVVTSLYRSLCLCQRILRVEGVRPEFSRYKLTK